MKIGYFEHAMLVSHLSAHHVQCLKPLNCQCKHSKTFFPKRYFTFLCNETTSKFILKQLDYSPSFSTNDSQLGCASLTICSYKTRARSPIVNYKLNMKRRELIKPDLDPPYTRLCKEDIKPSTKLFGDELSKHLKDMTEANKAGRQMQRYSDTRTSSHNYLRAGRQKSRRSNFKPYDRTSTGQKTSHPRPFLGYSRAQKSSPKKPSQSNNKD